MLSRLVAAAAMMALAGPVGADTLDDIAVELRLDDDDRAAARAAQTATLAEGRIVEWSGGGASGRVRPGNGWEMDGRFCRTLNHVLQQNGMIRGWREAVCTDIR